MIKVSVIIPTFNRSESIKDAVRSVLDQDLDDLEIIIIDDASDEQHAQLLKTIVDSSEKIKLIRNLENKGVSICRNLGLKNAIGQFIVFLDDDDVLLADMLKKSLKAIEKSNADVVSCRSEVKCHQISEGKIKRYNAQQIGALNVYSMELFPAEHIFLYTPQIHTFLIRRKSIGGEKFVEYLRYGEDMVFWLKMAQKDLNFLKLDFVGVIYNLHTASASLKESYHSKIQMYEYLLSELKLSVQVKNLVYMKMAYLSFSQKRVAAIKWLGKSLMRPGLLKKHVKYYFKTL